MLMMREQFASNTRRGADPVRLPPDLCSLLLPKFRLLGAHQRLPSHAGTIHRLQRFGWLNSKSRRLRSASHQSGPHDGFVVAMKAIEPLPRSMGKRGRAVRVSPEAHLDCT